MITQWEIVYTYNSDIINNNNMMDESALASGIYEKLKACISIRDKYMEASLQRLNDNPINKVKDEKVRQYWH